MSCGCGGMPPSVALRIEAAKLTVGNASHVDAAKAMHEFLRGGKTDDELDAKTSRGENPLQATARAERARLLGAPVDQVLGLTTDAGLVDRLRANGIHTAQALVQASEQVIRASIGVVGGEAWVQEALSNHGLRLRMSGADITNWLFDGNSHHQ